VGNELFIYLFTGWSSPERREFGNTQGKIIYYIPVYFRRSKVKVNWSNVTSLPKNARKFYQENHIQQQTKVLGYQRARLPRRRGFFSKVKGTSEHPSNPSLIPSPLLVNITRKSTNSSLKLLFFFGGKAGLV